ncbi:hypothetical protein MKW94_023599 [Papaver nudicaule]|uniref:E2 ubiquitin-conjugating enzyme n=1 Tax=Papaver nudicaule TaxID=74823 RepID=A0AA41UV49_PAPNU|nr:hypothetical protein [Papaver nudicaule]MCL7050110.1 hypothetical protein [Papaver nudicaule]
MSIEEQNDEQLVNDISDTEDDGSDLYDPENPESDYEFDEPLFIDAEFAALQAKFDAEDLPPGAEVSVPWLEDRPADQSSSSTVPKQFGEDDNDEVLAKFRSFKSFDSVEDFSDHHYESESVTKTMQASPKWTKAIQQDWRLLEKDLPETIFVRVYEGRMDLLRAVIVGAAGTPYHDGLYFFDVYFPPEYPDTPPLVNYHAHNLRINPNLYACGYVCLSLLNTWQGDTTENWTPGESTMLQVLLSIQALVLNEKPYFNEPGFEKEAGTARGEEVAQAYNESVFILSCKTMLYTLKNPPKYFEDYVLGHFRLRGRSILAACKAYIEGAQVGCFVEEVQDDVNEGQKSGSPLHVEGVQDDVNGGQMSGSLHAEGVQDVVNEGQRSCSSLHVEGVQDVEGQKSGSSLHVEGVQNVVNEGQKSGTSLHLKSGTSLKFKSEVGTMAGNLVPIFILKGVKNCEQFICLGDSYRLAEANYTNIFKSDFYKPVEAQVAASESQAQIQPFAHSPAQVQPFAHSPAKFHPAGPSLGHIQTHDHAYGTDVYAQAEAKAQANAQALAEALKKFGQNTITANLGLDI